jgi:hypothetical protein
MMYYLALSAGFILGWLFCALLMGEKMLELERELRAAIDDRDSWRRLRG